MNQINKNLVQRTIFPKIIKHLESPEITILTGSRQVGKTTLLFQLKDFLLKKGCPENNIFFKGTFKGTVPIFTPSRTFMNKGL